MEQKINDAEIVKAYYNSEVEGEWERLGKNYFEFRITCVFMEKYIKTGERVLDIGGGPGRYSLYWAEKGCDVTLFDLSEGNVIFAQMKAKENNLKINAYAGNALNVSEILQSETEKFDHVFLMGPLYHLLEEKQRITAVNEAMKMLKKGGKLYVSFISHMGGMNYLMRDCPENIINDTETPFIEAFIESKSYSGNAFTRAFFIYPTEVKIFMVKFNLKKLDLFGQEGFIMPCWNNVSIQKPEVTEKWLDICLKSCDKEEFVSHSDHIMFIGEKI